MRKLFLKVSVCWPPTRCAGRYSLWVVGVFWAGARGRDLYKLLSVTHRSPNKLIRLKDQILTVATPPISLTLKSLKTLRLVRSFSFQQGLTHYCWGFQWQRYWRSRNVVKILIFESDAIIRRTIRSLPRAPAQKTPTTHRRYPHTPSCRGNETMFEIKLGGER